MAEVRLSGTTGGKGTAQHGPKLNFDPDAIARSWLQPVHDQIVEVWKKAIDNARLADRLKAEKALLVKERDQLRMKVEDLQDA